MTPPRLNLLVLCSTEPIRLVDFYTLLGLHFHEEQHGKGPVHWAAEVEGFVLEIYPARSLTDVDQSTRLGFEMDDATSVVASLQNQGITILNELKQTQWGLRAVVKDSDGRAVELLQR